MKSILVFLQVEWVFWRILFNGWIQSKSSQYFWAYKKWTQGHSFRVVGAGAHRDGLAIFSYYKRSIDVFFRKEKIAIRSNRPASEAIGLFCQDSTQEPVYGPYIESVLKKPVDVFYFRDNMPLGGNGLVKIFMIGHLTVYAIFFSMIALFHSKKSHLGLMLLQWLENHSLAQHLHTQSVKQVFLFGGYENDSCFTGLCCKLSEVKMTMVPSANPIRNFYQQTIAHEFVFTAPFQRKEWQKYQSEWKVDHIVSWPMEGFHDLVPYFRRNDSDKGKNVLAFMSRGMWLRQLRGVQSQNNNMDFLYERNCMEVVKSFLIEHPEIKLLILPHPIEKREPEIWSKAMEHYNAFFQGVTVQFPQDVQLGSYAQFDSAEVSVASISSVNIERLFCGYKTIYAPVGASMDFFGGSELDHIVAKTAEDLRNLLERSFQLTETDFFRVYELNEYHFSHYSDFL